MHLKLITPDKLILNEEVDSVTLPGELGEMTVLPGHAMLVSQLSSGKLYFKKPDKEGKEVVTTYRIGQGFMEVQKDDVVILTSNVETSF
jgi:F-type H+-transporting ATPase subunit epsilon